MKKYLFRLSICCMIFILAGCIGNNTANIQSEASSKSDKVSITETADPVEKTESAQLSQETLENKNVFDELSGEEKRTLNVFFSNFAEAHFDEYDCENFTPDELYEFAFLHNRVNGTSEEEYDMFDSSYFEYVMGIRVQVMDRIIEKYFGVKVPHNDALYMDEYGRYNGWAFKDGYLYTGAASGESYDYFAVVTSIEEVGDGTYIAKYDKYNAGIGEMNKKYYSYTPDDARSDTKLNYCSSHIATITSVVVEGQEAWQLLKLNKV